MITLEMGVLLYDSYEHVEDRPTSGDCRYNRDSLLEIGYDVECVIP